MDITQNKISEIPEQNTSKTQNLGHDVLIILNIISLRLQGKEKKKPNNLYSIRTSQETAILR